MESQKEKTHINIVFVGHVYSGKSTTAGCLISMCRSIDAKTLQKLSDSLGKQYFMPDRLKCKRERGTTIDVSTANIESPKHCFTIINVPGHRDFVKNLITGTSQADAAVVVISATIGEFETGIAIYGQTRDHILLAFTLGVKQLIVLVNKMDDKSVNYSESRFNEIKAEVFNFIKKVGYNPETVPFVPISGRAGDNMLKRSSNLPWWKGSTLLETLDNLQEPQRPCDKPLRIPIQEVYEIRGIGTIPIGRVQSGVIKTGQLVTFAPSMITSTIKSIEMHHVLKSSASAGDQIGFCVEGISVEELKRGYVCGDAKVNPPAEALSFTAQIVIIQTGKIHVGYTPVIAVHTCFIACRFAEIISLLNRRTGQEIEKDPKFLKTGDAAIVRLVPSKPMVVEPYDEFPPLGRFAILDMKRIVGVGIIKQVTKKNQVKDILDVNAN